MRSECESSSISRNDAIIGALLTIGAALLVAAIMIVGDSQITKTIGLVMFPGVLTVGFQWTSLRDRPTGVKLAVAGGTLGVLFLIGLIAGLATQ